MTIKLCLTSAAIALILSVTAVQSQGAASHKKPPPQEPAVETTAVPPDPVAMQKWFSGAVDNILSDTDKTLKNLQGTSR